MRDRVGQIQGARALGFIAGNEHLDNWLVSNENAVIQALQNRTYGPKSLGDFLRQFTGEQVLELRRLMIELSFEIRSRLGMDSNRFILDIDSSSHEQYGQRMEGVEYCYKKFLALDSITAYDDLGLCYWQDVRPGSTYSSNGCSQIIHEIFSRMPSERTRKGSRAVRKIVRADSAFSKDEFYNACRVKHLGFVCAAKKNDGVKDKIARIKNWKPQDPDDPTRILATGGRECEIGHIAHHTKGYDGVLRLVVMRAKRPPEPGVMFTDYSQYDYYAFVTNMGKDEYCDVELIKLYRGRGNAENMIKEQKYGFDLKHFPCQKLTANKAFGLIASFAYNLTRLMGLADPRKKKTKKGTIEIVPFAKRLRQQVLLLPVQVICHAGAVVFRYGRDHYRRIVHWQKIFKTYQFGSS